MAKRRGKRVVVGYVVSHSGKRGGPWETRFGEDLGPRAADLMREVLGRLVAPGDR